VPFKTIYIHGLVRDAQGQKMSKSKGNIMDPLEVIDDYGCDALRFTLAALSAPAGRDVKLSDSRVEGYRNFATKLWNAARFCEMNEAALVADFDPAAVRLPLNRWIVSALAKTGRELDEAFAAYRFNDVASVLYHFIWHTYCDWYLEFAKPVLTGDDAAAKAELQATMAWVLGQVLHLLSPLMPFITEELWGHLAGEGAEPLITGSWPRYGEGLLDAAASEEMDWVIHLISEIRTLRGEMNVPPAAKVPLLIKDAGPEIVRRVEGHRDLIGRLARLESLAFTAEDAPKDAVQTLLAGGATALLPLAGIIDVGQEVARLEKELARHSGDAGKLAKKLGNGQFLAKAPEDVVAEQRERLATAEATVEKLTAAVARLKGLAAD